MKSNSSSPGPPGPSTVPHYAFQSKAKARPGAPRRSGRTSPPPPTPGAPVPGSASPHDSPPYTPNTPTGPAPLPYGLRPPHPSGVGPATWHPVPRSDTEDQDKLLTGMGPLVFNYPGHIARLRLLLKHAAQATERINLAVRQMRQSLARRQEAALRARAEFPGRVREIRKECDEATAEPRRERADLARKIEDCEREVCDAYSRVGLPLPIPALAPALAATPEGDDAARSMSHSQVITTSRTISTSDEREADGSDVSGRTGPSPGSHPVDPPVDWYFEGWVPLLAHVAEFVMGLPVGMSVAIFSHYLNRSQVAEFAPAYRLPILIWWAASGLMLMLLGGGMNHLFGIAGEAAARERDPDRASDLPPYPRVARYALMPSLVAGFVFVVEACLTRNAIVMAHDIQDKGNLAYYFGGVIFIMATLVYSCARGWRLGFRREEDRLRALWHESHRRERTERVALRQEERTERREQWRDQQEEEQYAFWVDESRNNHDAQRAHALERFLGSLKERYDALEAQIARIEQPYTDLITRLEKDLDYPQTYTPAELTQLEYAIIDAEAASTFFGEELDDFVRRAEPLPEAPSRVRGDITVVNLIDQRTMAAPPPAAPPTRLSLWQRIKAWFARLRGGGQSPAPGGNP